jgi:hypothetical protein
MRTPRKGRPWVEANQSSRSGKLVNPSARAKALGSVGEPSRVMPDESMEHRARSVMVDEARVICLLRYGRPDHWRRLMGSPTWGIRLGVGRTVWSFRPEATSGANRGLNRRTHKATGSIMKEPVGAGSSRMAAWDWYVVAVGRWAENEWPSK